MEKVEPKDFLTMKRKYGKVMTAYLNKKSKESPLTSDQKKEFYKLALLRLADLPADKHNKYDILFALDWAFHEMLEHLRISNQIAKATKGVRFRIGTNLNNIL